MNYMWDDLMSACHTTARAGPAHSIQQSERCPGRVCRGASRDTYNAEVRHWGEILYFLFPHQQTRKNKRGKREKIEKSGG